MWFQDENRRSLAILILSATLAFVASAGTLSLLSLDDCFYARKGIEQGRSGRFLTVTWNYHPTFQNPPLQFWILGRSFQWFGENDFSARLPSILMALGIVCITYRIGSMTVGAPSAIAGCALMILSPQFFSNARRCMLEIPTTFWIILCFWILIEGQKRDRLFALLAGSLGAAILTKSVLGLMPVFVFVTWGVLSNDARPTLRSPWLWLGVSGGLLIGALWPIHQYQQFGWEAIQSHLGSEIIQRSAGSISIAKRVLGYPGILLGSFQPVVLPAVGGIALLWKRIRQLPGLLILWCILPPLIYSFSSAQSSRYLFPIFPALSLCSGYAIMMYLPSFSKIFARIIAPAILIILAAILWKEPELILQNENKVLKQEAGAFKKLFAEDQTIPYVGNMYWRNADALMYYAERFLARPEKLEEVLQSMKRSQSRVLFCDSIQLPELEKSGERYRVILQTTVWTLILLEN